VVAVVVGCGVVLPESSSSTTDAGGLAPVAHALMPSTKLETTASNNKRSDKTERGRRVM
jgi:hypothetical protein